MKSTNLTRRTVLKGLGSAAALSMLPLSAWSQQSSRKLRVAKIGVAGKGGSNLGSLLSLRNAQVVALCDVDSNNLAGALQRCPGAKTYRDYRVLFDEMADEIDAVFISTPDHMHGPIAMAAMQLGKHVYSEKPLAHNVVENRQLSIMAAETGVVTQTGIQLSSSMAQRMTVEYIRSGLIGKVSEVHVWSNKQWGRSEIEMTTPISEAPENLDWNLWLGVCEDRPYRAGEYHPGNWRRLIDFGTGTLGDMGVHIFDTPYRALELTAPLYVRSQCREPSKVYHPNSMKTEYIFPATRYTSKKLRWAWYDGDSAPPSEIPGIELEPGRKLPGQGCALVGERGTLLMPHGSGPRTFPQELIRRVPRPRLKPMNHYGSWVDACLGKGETISPFSYGGPLCETLQLGVVAGRFPGKALAWDAREMRITNLEEANQYLGRSYRENY